MPRVTPLETPLFIAFDGTNPSAPFALLRSLNGISVAAKVGLTLFTAVGPDMVRGIHARGTKVFLDLKLHDVPPQVEEAARVGADAGATYLTAHTSGGREMLEAAVRGARAGRTDAKILGVTVLTSLDLKLLEEVGYDLKDQAALSALVVRRALLAQATGCGGVIASPKEAAAIRAAAGPDLLIVTPGIRKPDAAADHQKRTGTPEQAREDGANAIVVGSPITGSTDPAAAAKDYYDRFVIAA